MKKFLLLALALVVLTPAARADLSVGVAKKYARVIYDVAQNGGASVSHDLDATLPAHAVITNFWVYINETFTDSGTGSLALQCYGTNDLLGYVDITAMPINSVYAVARAGSTYNASSTYFAGGGDTTSAIGIGSIPAACAVTAVVRGDAGYVPLNTGKLTALIEYFQP